MKVFIYLHTTSLTIQNSAKNEKENPGKAFTYIQVSDKKHSIFCQINCWHQYRPANLSLKALKSFSRRELLCYF